MSTSTKETIQKQIDKLLLDAENCANKIADITEGAVELLKRRNTQSEISAMELLRSTDKHEKELKKITNKIIKLKEDMENL